MHRITEEQDVERLFQAERAILFERGVPRWNDSHCGITATAIAERLHLDRAMRPA